MVGTIDIKRLNMDELLGVVNIYPWYAGARMELCRRLAASGTLSRQESGQAALYVGSRRLLHDLMRTGPGDYSDAELSRTQGGVPETDVALEPQPGPATEEAQPRFFVVGGDYFSAAQYRQVRRADDSLYSSFASSEREDLEFEEPDDSFDLCTETLAGIYAEQGYLNEAKQIYSKLSLRYPEKSVYFASLIEKLDKK